MRRQHARSPGYSDLGEFELIAGFIDLSQQNKYNESLFCNDWILSKVTREHYFYVFEYIPLL